MKIAVVYARYSCDNQTEQSIEGQLRVCEQYAKNNDILIVEKYIDRAMTGTNDHRPDFQRMMKDSAKKEWDYVLVYKLDRFSRNKYESVIHKRTLKENGVKVLSAMENIPDSPEGIILESLLEGMNQYYSAELSQKVRRGMRETRLKGNYQGGGVILYGYKLEGHKLIIDEEKAAIVRHIFEQYSMGIFVRKIIERLTERGITDNGKPFQINRVCAMLRNRKYTGKYYIHDELFENVYPRIISDELFEKVRVLMARNRYGKRSVRQIYILRGRLFCGYCGMRINGESGRSHTGKAVYYYKCRGRKDNLNHCKKKSVGKENIEKFVLDIVVSKMQEPAIMDAIIKKLLDLQDKYQQDNNELEMLQKQKKQLETTLQNIMNAIEQGIVGKTTASRLKETEDQIDMVDAQILKVKNKPNARLTENMIRAYYTKMLEHEPVVIITTLVKEIKLYDDKIEVTFNTPIGKSPDDNQGFLFYSGTKQIGSDERVQELQADLYL